MVLGILIAAITAPGLLGSQEAIRQGQSKDKREEHRARRCNLIASCVKPSPRSREINGRPIVLRNGKLWIQNTSEDGEPFGHTYAGYYLPYPDTKYEGIVTTVTDVAPIMNWVYIDRETHEAKYGVRADAQPNLTGPFDCTRQDRRLTFDGWEGWCAVEEHEGYWSLHFDVDDDGLKSKVAPCIRVLEIELSRKEKKFKKDKDARQQDQTTKRAVDIKENAPIDQPLKSDPETQRPGVFAQTPPQPEMVRKEEAMPKLPPKTPPPACSVVKNKAKLPAPERSNKGAVDASHHLLALAVQATVPAQSTPPRDRSQSPSAAPQSTTPQSQTRVILKLNWNSGSKAIAQAQMFEALAVAQKDDYTTRRTSTSKRVSTASSQADSASVYSKEDQRLSRDIRPQSSVSLRAFRAQSRAPPVPTVQLQESKVQVRRGVTSQLSISKPLKKDEQLVDPAVLAASASTNIKRRSHASSSTQRVRSSKIFAAQRPGKLVSPRNSARKSLTNTMSSDVSRQRSSTTNRSLRAPAGSSKPVNRTRSGRKTTSAFLRDLDDLVNQEVLPQSPRTIRKIPISGKPVPSRVQQRGDQRQVAMVKQFKKLT